MAIFVSNRDGGKTDEEGHYRFQTNVWSGNVIGDGLEVTENSPLGMSVLVQDGDARIPYSDYAYTSWVDGAEAVTISTADPTNPRIDRIVMYVDRGEAPQTVNPNNPNIGMLLAVAGTPAATPSRPSDGAVDTAVGAGNPWIDLADVLVGSSVTQISNSNITSTRDRTRSSSSDYYEIARTVLTGTNAVIDASFIAHKYLMFEVEASTSGTSVALNLTFNGDTSPNYSNRRSDNGATAASGTSLSGVPMNDTNNTQSQVARATVYRDDLVGNNHLVFYKYARAGGGGSGNAPVFTDGVGKWVGTDDITSLQIRSLGVAYQAGSQLIVYGHN
jgi:hypothetical protein